MTARAKGRRCRAETPQRRKPCASFTPKRESLGVKRARIRIGYTKVIMDARQESVNNKVSDFLFPSRKGPPMTSYTLGLDLGTNSVGWAMVAREGEVFENGRCIQAGVRVFPAGLDMQDSKVGTPRGQERRGARSQRRTVRRREQRIRKLRRILQAAGLLPKDRRAFAELMQHNPYFLRARGVNERLEPHEFGRAIFHLGHRRGFKSNKRITKSKSDEEDKPSKDAKEDKKAEDAGKTLENHLRDEGITLGQYLAQFAVDDASKERKGAHKDPQGNKEWVRNHKRNPHYTRRTLRSMYQEEFDRLWSKQAEFHPALLTNDVKAEVYETIFYQRRLWWPLDSIGTCELTGDLRCPKGHCEAQEFRLLQEIANLQVYDRATGQEDPLSQEQQARLLAELRTKPKMTFKQIHKWLGLKPHQRFRGFEERAMRPGLAGNAVETAFAKGVLADWYAGLPEKRRAELHDLLVRVEVDEAKNRAYGIDEAGLRKKAAEWGLTAQQADELIDIQQNLPDGHLRFSLQAIRQLLPHIRKGLRVDQAIPAAGLKPQPKLAALDRLPPVKEFDRYLTNPLVCRALTEARKVVNMLITKHGKPEEVVIELAREMRQSRKHRREVQKRQKDDEALNKEAETEVAKAGGDPKSGEARRRYKLWKEYRAHCGDPAQCPYCPYCGSKKISGTGWLSADFEIDHIIPRSRRPGDNGFNNLLLCCAKCNRAKGNLTPYEWLGHDEERYDAMLRRVEKLPARKRDRFHLQTTEELETAIHALIEATDLLLKATQHTSRAAVAFLETLYPEEEKRSRVRCVKGFTTYDLRGFWGLNARSLGMGPADRKNRYDHRHHAIDAVVIALTTYKHVHNLCTAYARKERQESPDMPPPKPWPDRESFRREVQQVVDQIGEGEKLGVSYRPQRGLSGALHNEMGYGPLRNHKGRPLKNKRGIPLYATRKAVGKLTAAIINADECIALPARDLIRAECVRRGLAKAASASTKGAWELQGKWFKVTGKPGPALADPLPQMPCSNKGANTSIPIKRVRIRVPATSAHCVKRINYGDEQRGLRFVLPEDKRHMEVYRLPKGKWWGQTVSRMEAQSLLAERMTAKGNNHLDGPLIKGGAPAGATLRLWVCKGDIVLVNNPVSERKEPFRIMSTTVEDNGRRPDIVLWHHTVAHFPTKKEAARSERMRDLRERLLQDGYVLRPRTWRKLMEEHEPQKVSVDPIGRIFPCND